MRKTLLIFVILLVAAGGGYGYYSYTKKDPAPTVSTAKVTRGDIVQTVGATGTLQAVTSVQVGAQVSGTISQLNADFNSLVHKGQVLARLDPSLFQTQIDQARANLARAQADLDRYRVELADAQNKLKRAQQLFDQKLVSQVDLEAAQVAVHSAEAQVNSQQAAVLQSRASLQQNQVNLEHTVITAPIDGLVISRNVDNGQTVASSLSAPTLFVLAADLTKMQVIASLDESDVGQIRPGQLVRFRVDAYPNQEFTGTVSQVRLQPQTVQNVVTYNTVINVPNPDLKLKPGMTANVNIEIARRDNVLRVPSAALRFRPTAEIFQAFGQSPPAGGGGGGGGRGGGRGGGNNAPAGTDSTNQPNQPAAVAANAKAKDTTRSPAADQAVANAPGRGRGAGGAAQGLGGGANAQSGAGQASGQAGTGSGRGGNLQARMANMTPEERAAFMERMRARGIDPAAMGAPQGGALKGGRPGNGVQPAAIAAPRGGGAGSQQPAGMGTATTIDALFGPLPRTITSGQVWLFQDSKLVRVPLRLGITNGQQTEVVQGDLKEDQDVVINVITAAQRAATNAAGTAAPIFGPNRGGGGFPGGGGGGRGGR